MPKMADAPFKQELPMYWYQMGDDWTINGSLPEQAFAIALQGGLIHFS